MYSRREYKGFNIALEKFQCILCYYTKVNFFSNKKGALFTSVSVLLTSIS